eukprot:Gb_29792 [translate_table: standard]
MSRGWTSYAILHTLCYGLRQGGKHTSHTQIQSISPPFSAGYKPGGHVAHSWNKSWHAGLGMAIWLSEQHATAFPMKAIPFSSHPAFETVHVELLRILLPPSDCVMVHSVSEAETEKLTSLDEEALVLKFYAASLDPFSFSYLQCCQWLPNYEFVRHPADVQIFSLSNERFLMQNKADEVVPHLKGKSIFLVGMMGSGKTTVGKILSEALGYYFFDSDKLVEQAAGGASVAQIFKDRNEKGFRDSESEVLKQLSSMYRLVVATGGGAVVRPENWKYMGHGITVWLDVPLEALAMRVVAVGTESRPLLGETATTGYSQSWSIRVVEGKWRSKELHGMLENYKVFYFNGLECKLCILHRSSEIIRKGDPECQALMRLTKLYEDRSDAYANSDAKVSLQKIAAELGYEDVSDLTPTVIAIEWLVPV